MESGLQKSSQTGGLYDLIASMTLAAEALPDDPETLKAMLIAERIRSDRLAQIIKDMQRHRFGRRAEMLPADQLLLALEEVEQSEAEAAAEVEAKSPPMREEGKRKRLTNRGALPSHLPEIETTVDLENKACPCRGGELHRIGEEVSKKRKRFQA
jgi:transposase